MESLKNKYHSFTANSNQHSLFTGTHHQAVSLHLFVNISSSRVGGPKKANQPPGVQPLNPLRAV